MGDVCLGGLSLTLSQHVCTVHFCPQSVWPVYPFSIVLPPVAYPAPLSAEPQGTQ